jgi:hypothetical protein
LICLGYLSTWYASKSINLIWLQFLSTWYVLDIYQVDMSWISIKLICLGYLSSWYNSNFYQVDTTLISINLICVGYLSSWYNSNFYQLDMCWISIKLICLGYLSTWYVLDIYQVDMSWILSSWYDSSFFWLSLVSRFPWFLGGPKKTRFPETLFFRIQFFSAFAILRFQVPRYPSSSISPSLTLEFLTRIPQMMIRGSSPFYHSCVFSPHISDRMEFFHTIIICG